MKLIVQFTSDNNSASLVEEFSTYIDNVEVINSRGFAGLNIIIYILPVAGGIVITQVAKTIRKAMELNRYKSVTINGCEIKGYSLKQVKEIIEKIEEDKQKDKHKKG